MLSPGGDDERTVEKKVPEDDDAFGGSEPFVDDSWDRADGGAVIWWPWGAGVCGTRRGVSGHVGGAEAGRLECSLAIDLLVCSLAVRSLAVFVGLMTSKNTRRCKDVLRQVITLCSPLHGVGGPLEQFLWSEMFGTEEKREPGYVLVRHDGHVCLDDCWYWGRAVTFIWSYYGVKNGHGRRWTSFMVQTQRDTALE